MRKHSPIVAQLHGKNGVTWKEWGHSTLIRSKAIHSSEKRAF